MIMAFTIDVKSALIFAVTIPVLSVVVFGILPAFVCTFAIAYKRVPQASKNKPITNPVKIKRLRKECLQSVIGQL